MSRLFERVFTEASTEGKPDLYESVKNPSRNRTQKKGRPDADKSAASKAAARTNKRDRQKSAQDYADSPEGKQFHRKLGRFNSRGGSPIQKVSGEMDKVMKDIANDGTADSGNLVGLLRRSMRGKK